MVKRKQGGAAFDARAMKRHKGKNEKKAAGGSAMQLYKASDAILVLGDGDFTFSKGLVAHRDGAGAKLVATSYDSTSEVRKKYPNAHSCIQSISAAQAHVLHSVDATKLHKLPHSDVVPALFDYIIFNFPHSGQQRVHINRVLLLDFFESARPKLALRGEVHITLKTKPPYSNWNVEEQARAHGFVLKERRPFRIQLFPGYHHRTTDPDAKKFEPDQCITYVFIVDRSRFPVPSVLPPKTTNVAAPSTPRPSQLPSTVDKPPAVAKTVVKAQSAQRSQSPSAPRPTMPVVAQVSAAAQRDIRALIVAKLQDIKRTR
ncbi:hypothetical protein ACHHYP_14450 [Achlya hypogyna]|uniref:25S rRNA (uridine-N(3))-methyltransferase BMT5-like domain-containing protein n=1 Tax=Achlya hypogyna TaxID=1202772 RepID=A0A1V9ZF63_ACHHY|nr:hypothetical protein ACHHYP_14450 [Achlya hypogyna]